MPVNITNRQDAEALIREQVVSTIFQDAPKQSVFMGMARKLPNMTSKQTRIRVLDFLPTAYWVNGDTGMKQTTRQAWDNVYLTAGELAVIVPIPEAVLDDAEFDINLAIRYCHAINITHERIIHQAVICQYQTINRTELDPFCHNLSMYHTIINTNHIQFAHSFSSFPFTLSGLYLLSIFTT